MKRVDAFSNRILARFYKDADAKKRPMIVVAIVMVGTLPLMAVAFYFLHRMGVNHDELERLLASGTADQSAIAAAARDFHDAARNTLIVMIVAISNAVSSSIFTSYFSSSSSRGMLAELRALMNEYSSGDLSRRIPRDNKSQIGDIQEAIAALADSFEGIIAQIDEAALDLRQAVGEMSQNTEGAGRAIGDVAGSVSSISEGAAHQVQLVTRTSDLIQEIEDAIRTASDGATSAQQRSASAEQMTGEGAQRAAELREVMNKVRESSVETSHTIAALEQKSGDIDEIVRAITDIAAQTNLLALNAAIEAARAGEQGRGFAVVAEEVRKLAEDAQNSAGGIAALIDEIQEQTAEAVRATESGISHVDESYETASASYEAFTEISEAVRSFHHSTSEIAELAGRITQNARRVRERVEDVASVAEQSAASTQQISASTEETAAAADEVMTAAGRVSRTAKELHEMAQNFKRAGDRTGAETA